jgi:hypothetical protein
VQLEPGGSIYTDAHIPKAANLSFADLSRAHLRNAEPRDSTGLSPTSWIKHAAKERSYLPTWISSRATNGRYTVRDVTMRREIGLFHNFLIFAPHPDVRLPPK